MDGFFGVVVMGLDVGKVGEVGVVEFGVIWVVLEV